MFITFEGLDYCGKSTQVSLLKEYLAGHEEKVRIIREPGGTAISEKIRDMLLDKGNREMFTETELLLFSASRAQLVREIILPALKKNEFVISDRFHDSTIAYQGYGRGLDINFITVLQKLAIGDAVPDVTFLIDIPAEVSIQRKANNMLFEPDRIESMKIDFFERVRRGYLETSKKEERFVVLDGTKTIKELHADILGNIKKHLPQLPEHKDA